MKSEIVCCVIISFMICLVLFKFLKNRTIEIENFSNHNIVYTTNGKKIDKN